MTIGDRLALSRAAHVFDGGGLKGHSMNLATQDGSLIRFRRLERNGLVRAVMGRYVIAKKGQKKLDAEK